MWSSEFSVSWPENKAKIVPVEALILSKIMSTLSLHPVSLDTKWKHLDGLQVANPEFGTPRNVVLLLGVYIFSCVVFHGWRFGLSGSSSSLKMQFGWVLECCSHWAHFTGLAKSVLYLDHSRKEFESGQHVKEILGDQGSQCQATCSVDG